jgi:hypothetical protein
MFSVPLFNLIICCAEIVRQTGCLPLQHLEVLALVGALLTLCTRLHDVGSPAMQKCFDF